MTPHDFIELPALGPDVRAAYASGPMHGADLYLPESAGPYPWVLTVHGGFWRNQRTSSHMTRLCRALAAEGIACCNISYRRVGEGGGWPDTFRDVLEAAAFLHARAGTFVAAGFSAGGHLVLRLAAECGWMAGAVALAPVADLRAARARHLGEGAVDVFVPPGGMEEADPMLHPPLVPVLVVHGVEDDVVPVELSRGYAQRTGAELVEIEGANHLDLINPGSAAWPYVLDAIRRSSARATPGPNRR